MHERNNHRSKVLIVAFLIAVKLLILHVIATCLCRSNSKRLKLTNMSKLIHLLVDAFIRSLETGITHFPVFLLWSLRFDENSEQDMSSHKLLIVSCSD